MKKFILPVLIVLLFSACTTEEYYDSYYDTEIFNRTYSIDSRDWKVGEDITGVHLYYGFEEPRLTRDVFNNAILNSYLYFELDGGGSVLSPLPFSDFRLNRHNYKWEEQLTVEYEVGYITFILKIDDHALSDDTDRSVEIPIADWYDINVRFIR